MVFSSLTFLCVFLPAVFFIYHIVPGIQAKNGLLLIASICFYAYGEPLYIWLLVLSALVNYCFGLALGKCHSRLILALAVILNLGALILFKYSGFLIQNINVLTGSRWALPQIRLPIGISFYTFQAMSYVIDIYRGDTKPQKSFPRVLLYLSFFPQLIAGPIIKYHEMEQALCDRHTGIEETARGLSRFAAGLSKKVLLANPLGAVADAMFAADVSQINVAGAWIGAAAYLYQIYFDFSGYSDMAIGLGKMFGFRFEENFRYPYAAGTIREFWRRWHISLTSWFRNYLYIPLGGNRCGLLRTMCNRLLVFFLTGLWHGANLTFLVWGIYHGFFQIAETVSSDLKSKCEKWGFKVRRKYSRPAAIFRGAAAHAYTLLVICIGFVLFHAETVSQAAWWVREMFTGLHFERQAVSFAQCQMTPLTLTVFAAAVICACPVTERVRRIPHYDRLALLAAVLGLFFCMMELSSGTYNPFIYFQF